MMMAVMVISAKSTSNYSIDIDSACSFKGSLKYGYIGDGWNNMIHPLSWRWITNDRIDMRALGIILSDRDNNIIRYSKFTSSSNFTILSIPQIGSTFPNSWKHSCHKYYCNCIPLNQYMAILIKVIMKSNGQDVKPQMHWVLCWWRMLIENSLHDVIVILNLH